MSVKSYDDAIITRFRQLFEDSSIHILPVENAIRFEAQLAKDKVTFPLISTNRLGYSVIGSNVNQAAKMIGSFKGRDGENTNVFVQVIPIRIEYQLDIYTVDRASLDEITREFIFFFYLKPKLVAHFDYGLDINHNFNIFMNDDIVDNSDTIEHINEGVKFRNTITFYTDDAILVRRKNQTQGEIVADVHIMNKTEVL